MVPLLLVIDWGVIDSALSNLLFATYTVYYACSNPYHNDRILSIRWFFCISGASGKNTNLCWNVFGIADTYFTIHACSSFWFSWPIIMNVKYMMPCLTCSAFHPMSLSAHNLAGLRKANSQKAERCCRDQTFLIDENKREIQQCETNARS